MTLTSEVIQQVREDIVNYMVSIANDNSHGYSQTVRSLYNLDNPKSFDCSSLALTAIYYAFLKHGISPTPKDLGCSYTGNLRNITKCGFEIVAKNQTAHNSLQRADFELSEGHHVAVAVDSNRIVHARSSEGTSDTQDGSGNEIRVQNWYNYSKGWTHRLRFTGNGLSGYTGTNSTPSNTNHSSINQTIGKDCTDYNVKITTKSDPLNCRTSPIDGEVITKLAKGTTTTITRLSSDGTWGLCSSGWVKLSYTTKISNASTSTSSSGSNSVKYTVGKNYKTLVDNLNVRTGAGTNYPAKKKSQLSADGKKHCNSKGQYNKGTTVTCKLTQTDSSGNIWMKTPSGWLAAYYNGKKYIG